MRIKLFAVTVVLIGWLILAYASGLIKFPLLGLSDTVWTVFFAGFWLFLVILPLVLNYQYIFFSDETEKLIIRYFNAGIAGGKKNSLEIDKRAFAGYKTESKFFGLITKITLFQKFREGVAKYPPVYLSALSKEEKSKLLNILSSYVQN